MTAPSETPAPGAADRVTELLLELRNGDHAAFDELFPLVYDVLRRIAHRKLAAERAAHTLSTTDLVHEAYLKLVRFDRIEWRGRAHFLAIAAQSMRNILVDYALKRKAEKRGGGQENDPLEDALAVVEAPTSDLLALHEAMQRLEKIDSRQSRVVECRFFAGMSIEETAEALGVSPASVKRDWALARAWLNRELGP
ncbi:MAG: sigma-70 family RNA polymerase sigma factor [Candidatus Rokuibacteriota bacterium]|jgi:RNA polymerase sigma factor (TIGR02999 family)